MSRKIRPRPQKKPRSLITRDMILNCKGGPHKDKRGKRARNHKNRRETDHEDSDG